MTSLQKSKDYACSGGLSGFGDLLQSKGVQPCLVRQKTVADFTLGVLAGNLCIQAGEELLPCCEMLTIADDTVRFNGFLKKMSGYELEMLWKDGIVILGTRQWCLN